VSKVYFVGCGPGDPDLITIKAKKLLSRADVVVYSGSLIPKQILKICKKAELHDASGLVREEIFEILKNGAQKNKLVIRLHDGDPAIYGAIREQMDNLQKENIECEIVPGVTSFLASSAALGLQLTLPGVTQTIIITRAEKRTKVPEQERISELAKHKSTMIFYLSVHLLSDIVKEVIRGGYSKSTPVAVVYKASWPDQKVITGTLEDIVKKVWAEKITRTAIVMIGEVIQPKSYEYSKLYDKTFSHGFRKAKKNPQ
jgi:precorrin-4/cobalt-precorrin-4 C11-methyltransferase